jgi:C1A family cysteine protease
VDWTTVGAVAAVRDQGASCQSCWAFAVTAAIESADVIVNRRPLTRLSQQQLVDCTNSDGLNAGCSGGNTIKTLRWVGNSTVSAGVCSEAEYPYTGTDGVCRQCTPMTRTTGVVRVLANNDAALQAAVALQPVVVGMHVNASLMQFYGGNVLTSTCGASELNHAVVIVGYGVSTAGTPYWKALNSWGGGWGDHGFLYLPRNTATTKYNGNKGQCGVYMMPAYPTMT